MFITTIGLFCFSLIKPVESASSPGTCLPIDKGGTGCDDIAMRSYLGLGSLATLNSPLAVANGGTGATTVADARDNLGIGRELLMYEIPIAGTVFPANSSMMISTVGVFNPSNNRLVSVVIYDPLVTNPPLVLLGFTSTFIRMYNLSSTAWTAPANTYMRVWQTDS
jgi:hypothetical protein